MATVRPLRGLRFSEEAGPLANLTAPPYDVISSEMREDLAQRSPYNAVNLTLPEQEKGDRSKFVKYARSASRLEEWRRGGILRLEDAPSFYRYTQEFEIPGFPERITRTKLIGLIKVEPYSKGVILPHEQTFPKHKEDRLRILEATRTHLECIFGLFEDDDAACHEAIRAASAANSVELTTDEDGIHHRLEAISDPAAAQKISDLLEPKRVWIADGHHRYETALGFREQLGEKDGLIAEDFMMMALCSISDPGLVLLPTHRILKRMPVSGDELRTKLAEQFDLYDCPNSQLMARLKEVEERGGRALGVALPGGNGVIATVRNLDAAADAAENQGPERLRKLDVSILHGLVFGKMLGLTGHDFFGYTRSEDEAIQSVEEGAPAAFLMNPPTVDDMREIALDGGFMPQKSTYYYPKLLSGLVMWSLKDFSA